MSVVAELAACSITGPEQMEWLSPIDYRARVAFGMGSNNARFNSVAEVRRELPPERILLFVSVIPRRIDL